MSAVLHIPEAVDRHADEAAFLWRQRTWLTTAPHITLATLAGHDERLSAHLDGLHVAGGAAGPACDALLAEGTPGPMFVATVLALETRDSARFAALATQAEGTAAQQAGLASALGWVPPTLLQGSVSALLGSESPTRRRIGLNACAAHRVDPGPALTQAIASDDPALQARALRCAGELGRADLLPQCLALLASGDAPTRFWAAWSAVLLGDRQAALDVLGQIIVADDVANSVANAAAGIDALTPYLLVSLPAQGHAFLASALRSQGRMRALIHGAGLVGATKYVPWLLRLMNEPLHARLAGESFTLITGLNLTEGFDMPAPEGIALGPNDDPADAEVAMDEDRDLPWPHAPKLATWWAAQHARFRDDTRYFVGEPLSPEACARVLRHGGQRQRRLAALLANVLQPGRPLFNTAAPARRQQRALA